MDKKKLGEVLKAARKARKMTVQQLHEITGLSYNTIFFIETARGNPTIDNYLTLCNYFGLELAIAPK